MNVEPLDPVILPVEILTVDGVIRRGVAQPPNPPAPPRVHHQPPAPPVGSGVSNLHRRARHGDVEAAAKAMWASDLAEGIVYRELAWEDLPEPERRSYRRLARVAVAVLGRKPAPTGT